MRARTRMLMLYGCCHHLESVLNKSCRVIGTGNLSEDYIGYDTKGGDALADFFPIGDLYKSEVYQLLEYYRDIGILDEESINRIPSAGLWDGQTDEEELGYSYDEIEKGIRNHISRLEYTGVNNIFSFVDKKHKQNKHKHQAPPVISLREFCD